MQDSILFALSQQALKESNSEHAKQFFASSFSIISSFLLMMQTANSDRNYENNLKKSLMYFAAVP